MRKPVHYVEPMVDGLPPGSLVEIVELINEPGVTARVKRAILRDKYGCSERTALELCPDQASDY